MNVYAAIILCFIPLVTVFILFRILVSGVTIVKELLACLIGLIALVPITVLQFFAGNFFVINGKMAFSVLLRALILYGLIEEGIKGAVLFIFPSKQVNLKLMVVYSILAGLFLGCFESVIYLVNSIQKASARGGEVLFNMIYLRTFTSIVIHSFCSGLLGIFVYSAKKKMPVWSALVYSIGIHGLYDFFAIMPKPMNYFSYAAILLLILEWRILYVRLKERES